MRKGKSTDKWCGYPKQLFNSHHDNLSREERKMIREAAKRYSDKKRDRK